MGVSDRIEDKASSVIETMGRVYENMPDMKELIKLVENKQTELRLRFDNLTLDGDIALSLTLIKEEKEAE